MLMSPSLPINCEPRQFLMRNSRSFLTFSSNFVEFFVIDDEDVDKVLLLMAPG